MTTAEPTASRRRPTGRRAGDSGTRDAILDAARDLFAERGYEGASLRAIASAAGVDPALIRHFFGDKESLFASTVADRTAIVQRMTAALLGDSENLGERVADTYLALWEEPGTGPILQALVRSASTSPRAATMLVDVLLGRVRADGRFDEQRVLAVALAGTHLLGVAFARYVVGLAPLAVPDRRTLVAELAPTIQRYLMGEHR